MQGTTKQFHFAIDLWQSNSVASKAPVCPACHQGHARINQAQWNSRHSCNVKRMILDFMGTRSFQTNYQEVCYLSVIWRHAVQISAIFKPSKRKSFWRPTFHPRQCRLRRTAVYWRQEYHWGSKRIKQGICVLIHLCVDASSSLRIDPRSQRSSIPDDLRVDEGYQPRWNQTTPKPSNRHARKFARLQEQKKCGVFLQTNKSYGTSSSNKLHSWVATGND